jgi:hypothetical protein
MSMNTRVVGMLITAQGLILAGLLAWSQLWMRTYDIYAAGGYSIWSVSISLAATYAAALASLVGIALAVYSLVDDSGRKWQRWAVGFAGFSATVTFLIVIISAFTSWYKALDNWQSFGPIFEASSGWEDVLTWVATVLGAAVLMLWLFLLGPRLADRLSSRYPADTPSLGSDRPWSGEKNPQYSDAHASPPNSFWVKFKQMGEGAGQGFMLVGSVIVVTAFALALTEQPWPLFASVLGAGLGCISIGLGGVSVGVAHKSDSRYVELLRRIDSNVAKMLPHIVEGDIVELEGKELHPLPTGVLEKPDSETSRKLAQRRLDEDTKKVGYQRGELYQLPDGRWAIHWGGKYPL